MNSCCDLRDRIINVDCLHEPGKFILTNLPGCLPSVCTVRFTTSADFSAGDMIVVDEREYSVLTSQMEPAEANCFKAGAVVVGEIDRDRKLAFIRTGGAASTSEDVEFQTSDLVYYIDPLGDDSPNNPGGVDSPFKTLAGAARAAWENIVMNPLGKLVFSFNPGTYELTEAEQKFMTEATHPMGIIFNGTDSNNKPFIKADTFNSSDGKREYRALRLHIINSYDGYRVGPYHNATLVLRDSEVIVDKPSPFVIHPNCGGNLIITGTLKVDGGGSSPYRIFGCHQATLWAYQANIVLENFGSMIYATAYSDSGYIYLKESNFSGAITGMRYQAINNGVIHTNGAGPDLIPGTIAGTTSRGGIYI